MTRWGGFPKPFMVTSSTSDVLAQMTVEENHMFFYQMQHKDDFLQHVWPWSGDSGEGVLEATLRRAREGEVEDRLRGSFIFCGSVSAVFHILLQLWVLGWQRLRSSSRVFNNICGSFEAPKEQLHFPCCRVTFQTIELFVAGALAGALGHEVSKPTLSRSLIQWLRQQAWLQVDDTQDQEDFTSKPSFSQTYTWEGRTVDHVAVLITGFEKLLLCQREKGNRGGTSSIMYGALSTVSYSVLIFKTCSLIWPLQNGTQSWTLCTDQIRTLEGTHVDSLSLSYLGDCPLQSSR